MNELKISLFSVTEKEIKQKLMSNKIDIDKFDYSFTRNGYETYFTMKTSASMDFSLADVLMPLRQYIISTDGKNIFETVANYFDVFKKTMIVFDQGTLGLFTSNIMTNLENPNQLKKSIICVNEEELQIMFDLSPKEISRITFVSENSVYRFIERIKEKNIADFFVCSLTEFREPNTAEEKVFQPRGKSIIAIADEFGTDIKTYKYNGTNAEISYCSAQTIAWILLQKLKFGQ